MNLNGVASKKEQQACQQGEKYPNGSNYERPSILNAQLKIKADVCSLLQDVFWNINDSFDPDDIHNDEYRE